mgnify:CR=1 FL=1
MKRKSSHKKTGRSAYRLFLLIFTLNFLPLLILPLSAANKKLPPLEPYRTETPPVIDGNLDDPVWSRASSESGFLTWRPDFGRELTEKTIVYYAYDRDNLYFAFRCYDHEPQKIKASVTSRDSILGDDWICLNLDTFNDQQSLYAFYVNPLGIQADSRFEEGQEDYSVDVIWYSAGRVDHEGYSIEVQIPFKSIRYRHKEPVEMGIIFERNISRYSQSGTFPPLDPARGFDFLTMTRPLQFRDIKHYTLLEILPAATYGQNSLMEDGQLVRQKSRPELGLTGKYGLTSQLILDATINPDFSQVESDAGQVDFNLRYSLYYPEKRPFFLEGREKFTLAAAEPGTPLEAAVHTRTIIDPFLGLKMIGKVAPRDTVAVLYAMDKLAPEAENDYAHFTIGRFKHGLKDDSFIGGIWTGRFEGSGYNALGGFDGHLRLNPSSYLAFHALYSGTRSPGENDSRGGQALGFQYQYQTRNKVFQVTLHDLGKDFQTETGYLTRNGLTRLKVGFMPMFYPKSKQLLRLDLLFHSINTRDKFYDLFETYESFDLRLVFPRNTTIMAGARYQTEIFLGERFGRSGMRLVATSQFTKEFQLTARYNYGQKIRYVQTPYQGRGMDALCSLTYLPSEKIHFVLSLTYSDFLRSADGAKEYDYAIIRSENVYQFNKYLFFRAIVEYNSFWRKLTTDFLISFTYIPGTVVHAGYGSLYEKIEWREDTGVYEPSDRFLETRRSFFFKVSYLWRL